MKYVIEIDNPRRPVSYVGTRGYAANKSDAKVFRSDAMMFQNDVRFAAVLVPMLENFHHLDDSFYLVRVY